MGFECRVERDSISPAGTRLTTFVVQFPRIVLCEFLTHRMLSRNSSSSRAIPVAKMIEAVERDPYIPSEWGSNQKGMQAGESLSEGESRCCAATWKVALKYAVTCAKDLAERKVHKQLVNRLLEPFAWITVIVSATDWNNFFALRCHPDAHPEIRKIAEMMRAAREASKPRVLKPWQWHLPFISDVEQSNLDLAPGKLGLWKMVSAGRCARVSYLTHDGQRDIEADVALARRLIEAIPKHASPFEHQATPFVGMHTNKGNLFGWKQYRHEIEGESVPG